VCGAGNSPERRFCRRCGNSLAAATIASEPPVPWYRRLFVRTPRVLAAGDRPESLGRSGRSAGWFLRRLLLIGVLALVLVPVIAYLAVPGFKSQVDALIGRGGSAALLLQHPAANAVDRNTESYWLAEPGTASATLTVRFSAPLDLAGLTFLSGAAGEEFDSYGRPRSLTLEFHRGTTPVQLLLDDTDAPQRKCLPEPINLQTFDIRIDGSYPSTTRDDMVAALREVNFLRSCP
jgi:hypothetical protein